MDYKNLVILGTSHIAKQSLKEVRESIKKEKPSTAWLFMKNIKK